MRGLTPLDFTILSFLSDTPRPVRELVEAQPRGSVYRHLKRLQADGWVIKRRHGYALTAAGRQVQAEQEEAACLGGLGAVYTPLTLVPSPCHRALLELALAALVIRQLTAQEERHPSFLLMGPTMTWKTSAGKFLCQAAGVDPISHVVDLASESGRSLWIRRSPDGEIATRRGLLEAPVVVFDELQLAEPGVRRALAPFLSGRRRVPVENDVVSIAPVALVTMNPGSGHTLTERTGLATPQLRRMIICDLGMAEMPDLALVGGRALEAAASAGPLRLRPPQDSAERFRPAVVDLLRQVLQAEALGLVDVDLLLGLATGMSAWLPTAIAVRQVLSDFLLIVDTIGWTQPRWTDALRGFSGTGRERSVPALPASRKQGGAIAVPSPSEPRIQLFPAAIEPSPIQERSAMSSGYSMLPSFSISDHTKADVIWLARDAGVSVDQALQTLVEIYKLQHATENDFWDLETILHLRQACDATEVTVSELREGLSLFAGLQERGLTLDHVRTTLKVAEDLSAAGLYLNEAVAVADVMEAMEEAGIDPSVPAQLQTALVRFEALGYTPERIAQLAELWERLESMDTSLDDLAELVAQMEHLRTLGLDTPAAEALATALELARIPEAQRAAMLAEVVEKGVVHLGLPALYAERDALRQDIQQLQDEHAQLQDAVAAARDELIRVQQQEEAARERTGSLGDSARKLEDAISAAQALEAFLLGLDPGDRIFVNVAKMLRSDRSIRDVCRRLNRSSRSQFERGYANSSRASAPYRICRLPRCRAARTRQRTGKYQWTHRNRWAGGLEARPEACARDAQREASSPASSSRSQISITNGDRSAHETTTVLSLSWFPLTRDSQADETRSSRHRGDRAHTGRSAKRPGHPQSHAVGRHCGSPPSGHPSRRRHRRGLLQRSGRGSAAGPLRRGTPRPVAHPSRGRRALRGHETVAAESCERPPGRQASLAQDHSLQRAPPCPLPGPNAGLTSGQVLTMILPQSNLYQRTVGT